MYTYCTESEWCSEEFSEDYMANLNGVFETEEDAIEDSKKHGYEYVIILEV